SWDAIIPLPEEVLQEMSEWLQNLELWNGRTIIPALPEETLFTDASSQRWGAALNGTQIGTAWKEDMIHAHINLKELTAVYLALRAFKEELRNKTVLIRADNTTAVAYLRNFGGTKSEALCRTAQRIWDWALSHNISIQVEHIPG